MSSLRAAVSLPGARARAFKPTESEVQSYSVMAIKHIHYLSYLMDSYALTSSLSPYQRISLCEFTPTPPSSLT